MKKVLALVLLFALVTFGQEITTNIFSGTVANSAAKTFYVKLITGNTTQKVDSVELQGIYTGEIDIDQMIVTKGVMYNNTFYAVATPDTTTLTIDNAASTTTAAVYSASSTGLNSLTGYDTARIVVTAGSGGNDATDPNALIFRAIKYLSATK